MSAVESVKEYNQINITKPDSGGVVKSFAFDSVYDWNSIQRDVYDETAFPLIESVIEGYNGTIFAYGQTGCGKTHTMIGLRDNPEQKGIIPHTFDHIFGFIDEKEGNTKFLVRASYLEIYNEEIRDLLSHKGTSKLNLAENKDKGIYVKGLTMIIVKSIPEIEKVMNEGTSNRKTAETKMNKESSRSHCIFTIYIETAEEDEKAGDSRIKAGKLNLVDLAGSERQSKTGATGETLKEATKINLSLSALGNVISALVDGKSTHIPYRDSKLTRLLQDSLGGNTKTVMIAALSPADYNYDETLSTLRYASRAKSIKNKPTINEDPKDALLREYEDEIKRLKKLLDQANKGEKITFREVEEQLIHNNSLTEANLRVSMENKTKDDEDETVEYLLEKLRQKGKKIKVIGEEDEDSQELECDRDEYPAQMLNI